MTRLPLRVARAIALAVWFLVELVVSSVRVAWDVLTPTHRARPGVIAVPLRTCTDTEITLLANLISLTPGSLTLDVSPDRRTLYVHVMFVEDPDEARRTIRDGAERHVLGVMRSRGLADDDGGDAPC